MASIFQLSICSQNSLFLKNILYELLTKHRYNRNNTRCREQTEEDEEGRLGEELRNAVVAYVARRANRN